MSTPLATNPDMKVVDGPLVAVESLEARSTMIFDVLGTDWSLRSAENTSLPDLFPPSGPRSPAMRRAQIHLISTLLVSLLTVSASAQLTSLKTFDIPGPSNWVPEGCRDVEQSPDALTSRATWRSLHSDVRSSDEITGALAPVFETEWIAEPNTYNPTGPVFDSEGNVYFSPLAPIEPVVMISLDPVDGSRRWSIPATTNAPVGFHTPLVLKDPTDPDSEALFLVLADRAIAVRPDGSTIWDVDDVPLFPNPLAGIIGIQYHGPSDSLIAVSTDGYLLGIDRSTGAVSLPLVELPGEVTRTPLSTIPFPVVICMQQKIAQLTDLAAAGLTFLDFINLLLGNGIEVANSFRLIRTADASGWRRLRPTRRMGRSTESRTSAPSMPSMSFRRAQAMRPKKPAARTSRVALRPRPPSRRTAAESTPPTTQPRC